MRIDNAGIRRPIAVFTDGYRRHFLHRLFVGEDFGRPSKAADDGAKLCGRSEFENTVMIYEVVEA